MDYLSELIERYPLLSPVKDEIIKAFSILKETYSSGGKLLIAGNGGSASDSLHITGELMKSFVKKRPVSQDFKNTLTHLAPAESEYLSKSIQVGLPAISLVSEASLLTACINDIDGNIIYAQQVYGYGNSGDTFLGISTSGNAKNIMYAMITSKAKNIKTIALTGAQGGLIKQYADISIIVPETETYKIQELHLPVYHALCLMLEEHFFP